jgi:hypothetical protein
MGWKDRATPVEASKSSWKDRAERVEVAPPDTPANSPITAATTGIIEGAVPFAASLAGLGKAGMDAVTGVRGPLGGGSFEDLVQDYRSGRDQFSDDAKQAADAHPAISVAGNVAGGIANPLFHGANTLPKAAGASSLQALGMSDADLTKPGNLKEAAKDAAIGGIAGSVGYGIGKAIPKVAEGLKTAGKKALTNLGPSEEAINARFAGRAQDSAKSYPELAEDMKSTLKGLRQKIGEESNEAWNVLSPEADIPKQAVTQSIDDAINQIKIKGKLIGPADNRAANVLAELKGNIDELGGHVSEQDMKSIIQSLDENINWEDQGANRLNTLLEKVRNGFDDTLKGRNSNYAKAMQPVAEKTRLLSDLKRHFNFKDVPGEGLVPTDTSASKMQASLRDNKAVTEGNLEKLKDITGKDYLDLAKDYQLSQQFDKTGAQGSKRTNLGAALGTGIGGLAGGWVGAGAGSSLGALTGATMDRYGGQAAGKIIDSLVKSGNSKAFGKFAPIIEKAAARGPEALAVAGAILSENPEFQKVLGEQTVRVRNRSGRVRRIPKYRLPAALEEGEQVMDEGL